MVKLLMKKIDIVFKKANISFNKEEFKTIYKQCGYPMSSLENIISYSHKILLAYHNDEIIGFVTTLSNGENYVYYDRIGVREGYRGKGIGRKLFAFILKYYKNIPIHSVIARNELVKFFERFGFECIGEEIAKNGSLIVPMLKINKSEKNNFKIL